MGIKYLELEYDLVDKPLWYHTRGLMQTASGYGSTLVSPNCILIKGEKRLRRVYITCFGNVGSAWVKIKGERLYLR